MGPGPPPAAGHGRPHKKRAKTINDNNDKGNRNININDKNNSSKINNNKFNNNIGNNNIIIDSKTITKRLLSTNEIFQLVVSETINTLATTVASRINCTNSISNASSSNHHDLTVSHHRDTDTVTDELTSLTSMSGSSSTSSSGSSLWSEAEVESDGAASKKKETQKKETQKKEKRDYCSSLQQLQNFKHRVYILPAEGFEWYIYASI